MYSATSAPQTPNSIFDFVRNLTINLLGLSMATAHDWEAHRRAIGTKFPPPTPGPPALDLGLFALKGKQDQVRRGGL